MKTKKLAMHTNTRVRVETFVKVIDRNATRNDNKLCGVPSDP
jgi:hypothetical protein